MPFPTRGRGVSFLTRGRGMPLLTRGGRRVGQVVKCDLDRNQLRLLLKQTVFHLNRLRPQLHATRTAGCGLCGCQFDSMQASALACEDGCSCSCSVVKQPAEAGVESASQPKATTVVLVLVRLLPARAGTTTPACQQRSGRRCRLPGAATECR